MVRFCSSHLKATQEGGKGHGEVLIVPPESNRGRRGRGVVRLVPSESRKKRKEGERRGVVGAC